MTDGDEQPRLKGRLGRKGREAGGTPPPGATPPGSVAPGATPPGASPHPGASPFAPPAGSPGGLPPASATPPPARPTGPPGGGPGGARFGRIEPSSPPPAPGSPWATPPASTPTPPASTPTAPGAAGSPWAPAEAPPPGPGYPPAGHPGADPTFIVTRPDLGAEPHGGDAVVGGPDGGGAPAGAEGNEPPAGGRGGKRLRLVAVAAGVLVLGAVGFFVQRALRGDAGGASSPEAAAQQLVDALNNEDPVAAAAVIDPEEVHTLGELLGTVEERLAEADIDTSPGKAAGLDVTVEDVTFRTRDLGDGVAEVEIGGGRARWKLQPDEMAERTKAAGVEADSDTIDRSDLVLSGSNDRGDYEIDPHLVAVKRGDGWYVSIAHTVASYLAEAEGLPSGDFRSGPPDDLRAAASPEDAAVALLETAGDLDPETTLASLPTDEWGVLWTYRDAVEEFVDREQPADFSVTVDRHDVDVSDLGGGYRKVTIASAEGTYRYTDEYEGPQRTTWTLDGWCLRGDGDESCLTDGPVLTDPETYGITLPFVVVKEARGGWVVSPNATLLEYGKQIAETTTPEVLYRWIGPERVAPPDGTLTLDTSVTATLNSGAYARYDIELTKGRHVFVSHVDEDDRYVGLYDPDGDELWSYRGGAISIEETGTYRLVAWGTQAGQEVDLLVGEVPVEQVDGATAAGELTPERPIVDFGFQVPESGLWSIAGDGEGFGHQVLAEDRETWLDAVEGCDDVDACGLSEGRTYYLRVYRYDDGDGAVPFSLDIVPGATTSVDGSSSTDGYVSSGSDAYHDVEVPAGVTATLTLEGDDDAGDLDLSCLDLGCDGSANVGAYEQVTIRGPVSGQVHVYGYSGASGGYTLSIRED